MGKIQNRIVGSGEEPLDQIQFNPRNWRVHPLNQQNALKGVLDEVGWVQEVIVNKRTGNLIDGHLRCQLAAREGAKTIPVKYVDLSEEEEALILSTLDPIAGMATTDKQKLDDLFASIETENADVLKMLDDIAEKERLEYAKRDPVDAEPQIDRAAELNEKWQVVTGDLWQIGEHRLLCGDSTKREDVERVMAGEKADMVWTDPPYGVSYIGVNSPDGRAWAEIENDNLRGIELKEFLKKAFKNMYSFSNSDIALYCWHASSTQIEFEQALNESGFEVKQQLIWNKGMVLGHSDYHWSHEPVFYCHKAGQRTYWYGDRTSKTILGQRRNQLQKLTKETLLQMMMNMFEVSTAWEIDRDSVIEYRHSTQKPTRLAINAIKNSSSEEQIVSDYFIGSGTTMVACQNLNRRCRAIEISPNYCAVILERMTTAFPELEIKRTA